MSVVNSEKCNFDTCWPNGYGICLQMQKLPGSSPGHVIDFQGRSFFARPLYRKGPLQILKLGDRSLMTSAHWSSNHLNLWIWIQMHGAGRMCMSPSAPTQRQPMEPHCEGKLAECTPSLQVGHPSVPRQSALQEQMECNHVDLSIYLFSLSICLSSDVSLYI